MHFRRCVAVAPTLSVMVSGCVAHTPVASTESQNKWLKEQPSSLAASSISCQRRSLQSVLDRNSRDFSKTPKFSLVAKGQVTVIFDDGVRVRKSGSNLVSTNAGVRTQLEAILKEFGVREAIGLGKVLSEADCDAMESRSEVYWGTDVPNLRSMYVLQLSEAGDASMLSERLQALPWVKTAYPTPSFVPASQNLARWDTTNLSGTKPTDTRFGPSYSEQNFWHWFNRHKIFHAWTIMGSTAKPTVAVIDSGFDTDIVAALDRPNYEPGTSFDSLGNINGTDVTNDPINHVVSHGTQVAAILGSPKDNSDGLCGVVPSIPILPIKAATTSAPQGTEFYTASLVEAVNHVVGKAKVLNMSVQTSDGKPVTWDPTLRTAIANATASGISVVIPAGNRYTNLDLDDPLNDAGAIIIGGSQRDTGMNWKNNALVPGTEGAGSNYGKAVHLVASAYRIDTPTYNPRTGSRTRNMVNGTSFSTPMVAGAVAMTRAILDQTVPTLTELQRADMAKQIIWGTATIGANIGDGTQHGWGLEQPCMNAGNAKLRELNMANALIVAQNANKQLLVRVMNTDDSVEVAKNSWANTLFTEGNAVDSIWDLSTDGFQGTDAVYFRTDNLGGERAHGYQIWTYGWLNAESVGGAAERRAPWGVLHSIIGEDVGATTTGYHYSLGFRALIAD